MSTGSVRIRSRLTNNKTHLDLLLSHPMECGGYVNTSGVGDVAQSCDFGGVAGWSGRRCYCGALA